MKTKKMRIYGFHNGEPQYSAVAYAIDENGVVIASHFCSNQRFARHDLGMDGRCVWKHDIYDKKYPGGWETEFVITSEVDSHQGLVEALKLNKETYERKEEK